VTRNPRSRRGAPTQRPFSIADASTTDAADAGAALVPRASWEAVCQETAQLEDELKQKDKRMLRLRRVFTARLPSSAFYDNGQGVISQYDLGAVCVFQPVQDVKKGSSDNGRE
jgi:hypothetical protein